MGCCTLLIIEKVLAVESPSRNDLDYGKYVDFPAPEKGNHYKSISVDDSAVEKQRKAEELQADWVFTDPRRVAAEGLMKLAKTDSVLVTDVKQVDKAQARFVYRWQDKATKTKYIIVVSRRYWLTQYAKDQNKIAWTVSAAYERKE